MHNLCVNIIGQIWGTEGIEPRIFPQDSVVLTTGPTDFTSASLYVCIYVTVEWCSQTQNAALFLDGSAETECASSKIRGCKKDKLWVFFFVPANSLTCSKSWLNLLMDFQRLNSQVQKFAGNCGVHKREFSLLSLSHSLTTSMQAWKLNLLIQFPWYCMLVVKKRETERER